MDALTFQAEAMRYERLMFHISWSMLGNNEDCADAVQEALTRAWQKRAALRSMDSFRPWLMRILTNTCNDMLRKRSKHRIVPLEDETVTVEPPQEPIPLEEAIEKLKPDSRLVVVLFYLEGYSVNEIAETLGIPAGTVKSRMKHARDRLSALLHDEWEGQE